MNRSIESETGENSGRKLQKRCDDGDVTGGNAETPVDRISYLPDAILCHILSFLPTKSAVATSFLSKSWSRRWTGLTSFDFKDLWWREYRSRESESSLSADPGGGVPKMDFVGFVNMVLLNQSAENSISRFRLQIKNRPFVNFSFIFINIWVSTAIARNVRVLDLDMSPLLPTYPRFVDSDDDDDLFIYDSDSDDDGVIIDDSNEDYHDAEFHLPDSLYTCGTLEVLKLKGAFLVKPPSVVSLPKLTAMKLKSVKYESDESFHRLISGCRMLHTLVIIRYHYNDGLKVCTISSPVLKHLRYYLYFCRKCGKLDDHHLKLKIDTPALEYIYLSDFLMEEVIVRGLTSLNEAVLDIPYDPPEKTVELVQAFDQVKTLTLFDGTMRTLRKATNRLSPSFDKLTKLVAPVECCQFSHLMHLIDCCATLKVLQIKKCRNFCRRQDTSLSDPHPRRIPRCFFSSLTQVSYSGFEGHANEKAILRFIAVHASMLTRLDVRGKTRPSVLEEMMMLMSSAVSSTCAISIS